MLLKENLKKLLEEKLKKLNKLRPLSKSLVDKLKEKFEIEMTYNSNAIEGNSLTLKETYWIIQQGITVKGKPLKDHLEAKNHKEALDYLYELIGHKRASTISENLIKTLHSLVIQDIDKRIAGRYRDRDVFIAGTDHTPPSSFEVPIKMAELIKWAKNNIKKMNIVEFSAILHHKFVHIHPFEDGNGRTGRLLMNVFLMRYGFPLVIIQNNDRQKYYRVLAMADKGNYKPLVNFIAQTVLRSLNIYLDTLTPSKEKEKWITLAEATKYCSYSQAYLGKLAKEGKIDAHKIKRNWVTTKEAIQKYVNEHKKK
ncbi:Fic family protein [Candidatus Peregrinibacteria bacterium]|nr:Fic family protein [Candidatus Peregrinibacteria bacterium]